MTTDFSKRAFQIGKASRLYRAVLLLIVGLGGCQAGSTTTLREGEAVVLFPIGACETGVLEVYIDGKAHPTHPTLEAEDCLKVDRAVALASLEVRCIDPDGLRAPSAWVGPAVADGSTDIDACAQVLE